MIIANAPKLFIAACAVCAVMIGLLTYLPESLLKSNDCYVYVRVPNPAFDIGFPDFDLPQHLEEAAPCSADGARADESSLSKGLGVILIVSTIAAFASVPLFLVHIYKFHIKSSTEK